MKACDTQSIADPARVIEVLRRRHRTAFLTCLAAAAVLAAHTGCRDKKGRPPRQPATTRPTATQARPARPGTVMVAAVQCYSRFGEPKANRAKLARLVRRAAANGAKIVVLPEAAVTGYLSADLKKTWHVAGWPIFDELEGVVPKGSAETVPGPSTRLFGKLADELDIYLTVPLLEVDATTGNYYNTSVLMGPDGRMLIHYRKCDPWPWAEQSWATPGDRGNPVVNTPFGRVSLLICFDIHAQAEVMARKKVDTLLYSIAWVDHQESDWYTEQLPAIARTHGFNIIAANWTVPKNPAPDWHGYGQSRIISAGGKVLAKVTDDLAEEIIYAHLPIPVRAGDQPK